MAWRPEVTSAEVVVELEEGDKVDGEQRRARRTNFHVVYPSPFPRNERTRTIIPKVTFATK